MLLLLYTTTILGYYVCSTSNSEVESPRPKDKNKHKDRSGKVDLDLGGDIPNFIYYIVTGVVLFCVREWRSKKEVPQ